MDKELLLNLYLDDELDEDEKLAFEKLLKEDAQLNQQYQALMLSRDAYEAWIDAELAKVDVEAEKAKIFAKVPFLSTAIDQSVVNPQVKNEPAKQAWSVLAWINQYQQALSFSFASILLTLVAAHFFYEGRGQQVEIKGGQNALKIEHSVDQTTTIWMLEDESIEEQKKKEELKKKEEQKKKEELEKEEQKKEEVVQEPNPTSTPK